VSRSASSSRSPLVFVALIAAVQAWAPSLVAHGGEDHGEAPPPPTAADGSRTATATTTALEVVLRWPARAAADGPQRFRVLVSDYATNAPVEGAEIEMTFTTTGKPDVVAKPAATKSPGIYEADAALPVDAHYALSATIIAGELVDVIAVSDVDIGPPPPVAAEEHHEHALSPVVIAVVAGLVLVVLALIVMLWRRRRRTPASATVATAVVALFLAHAPTAVAHGGEDHSHPGEKPASTAAPSSVKPGRVFLAKESQFLLGIRTAVVSRRALADRVLVPGVVTAPPERHAAVFLPQSGRVTPPRGGFPQLGAPIKKGQMLGSLESILAAPDRATFIAEEAKARGDIAAASARLDAAEKALARVRSLSGVASTQDVEKAQVEVASARAALGEAEARRGAFSTSAGVSRFDLVSPLDGVLADIDVSPGETLNQGDRAFLVVDPRELTVEAKVPEHELARLLGSGDALVDVDAYPGRSFPGKLLAQAQVVDEATRTSKVIFSVDNKDGLLKLGMFANVQIGAGGAGADASVVAVPDAAVLDVDGRRVVYLHVGAEEFEAKDLSLGRRDGDLIEVKSGLEGGERIVVIGAYNLRSAQAR
jgi:cobalt-zinc-cadmium efflux system membrane fusion protein